MNAERRDRGEPLRSSRLCGLVPSLDWSFILSLSHLLPRDALGLAEHPFQGFRAGVGAVDVGDAGEKT